MIRLSISDARKFHRRAVLLDSPAPSIDAAMAHHGFIQIDPINVCGRMQDLILRNRVTGYREEDLLRYLHGNSVRPLLPAVRVAFEHHLPHTNVLAAMPVEAWPYLLSAMRRRSENISSWAGQLDAEQTKFGKSIIAELAARGPLCSSDIEDERRGLQGWGPRASLAKITLQKLFFHGRVLISHRAGNRRYYHLPERILPAAVLSLPEPSAKETKRWIALLKLRQRRLSTLIAAELPLVNDAVEEIQVEGCSRLFCLKEDLRLLDEPGQPADVTLLAPLDPLIYDRRVTRQLWNFDYTWEVYTPPARRARGYYALPILSGLEIVGHIDPKADREKKKLTVVTRSVRRGHRAAPAVRSLALFLGLRRGASKIR